MSAAHAPGELPSPAWSSARKVAAVVFGLVGYAALACAAAYLSAALFLLLNKADPTQARLTSIARYWQLYADDPPLRKKLQASVGLSAAALLLVLPAAMYSALHQRRALHGNARFATASEIQHAGLIACGKPGILVGKYRGKFLSLQGQRSVVLSAPTRSGKSAGVVIPNLLNWPDSTVALDVKKELYNATAGYRRAHGQAVFAFAPFDEEARSHRWNPLSAVRTSELHRVGDLLGIGQVFYPNDGGGTSSEAFFSDQARNLFLGLGLLLLESTELPRTIGEMLRQSSGKGRPLKLHLTDTIEQRQEENRPLSDECVDALQRLLSSSEATLSSIVATFNAPLTIFADAIVDAATSADDFRLEDVRRLRSSIYVCVPPHRLASARPLLNLFFSQLVSLNTRHLPEQDPTLRYQCLQVNDEFTAMGRVPIITTSAAFLAGYNLRLLTVVQAMSQLDAIYGEKEARTFATNHGLQILFAPREQRDANEYSEMLGHFTERSTSHGRSRSLGGKGQATVSRNDSEQRRALLLPQEFKELGSERLVIMMEGCKPILGDKIRYYGEKVFQERLLPPPPVPEMDMQLHFARVQQRWRLTDGECSTTKDLQFEALAYDMSKLPALEGEPEAVADALSKFLDGLQLSPSAAGGSIEPSPDEDGVLAATEAGSLARNATQPDDREPAARAH